MNVYFVLVAYHLIYLWIRKWLRYQHSWLQINVLIQPITWKHPSPRTLMHAGNYCLLLKFHFNNNSLYTCRLCNQVYWFLAFLSDKNCFPSHFNHYCELKVTYTWDMKFWLLLSFCRYNVYDQLTFQKTVLKKYAHQLVKNCVSIKLWYYELGISIAW